MGQGGARGGPGTPPHAPPSHWPTGEGALLILSHSTKPEGQFSQAGAPPRLPGPLHLPGSITQSRARESPSSLSPRPPQGLTRELKLPGEEHGRGLNTDSTAASGQSRAQGRRPTRRKAAGKAKATRSASQGSDHHTQGQARPDPGTGKSGAVDSWGRESVASPRCRKEKVVPGRGGRRGEGGKLGEALWLLRFSGIVKQEAERRGRNLGGKNP